MYSIKHFDSDRQCEKSMSNPQTANSWKVWPTATDQEIEDEHESWRMSMNHGV